MHRSCARVAFAAFLLGVVGCGSSAVEAPPTAPASSVPLPIVEFDLLKGNDDVDVAALLKRSREELAALAEETEGKLAKLEQWRQEGRNPFVLLPEIRLPLATPIFREAKFSAKRGISVPPYLGDDASDPAAARRVAACGDLEGAAKIGGSAAPSFESLRLERNYPLEWTRLASLLLVHAEYRAACDDKEGVRDLIAIHRQLRQILNDQARKSPLGQALLSRGLRTLKLAAKAWNETKRPDLSKQVDGFLASLDVPTWSLETPARIDGWERGTNVQAVRLLDLLGLELPKEGADEAFVFFDRDRKAAEIVVAYAPVLSHYHDVLQFAYRLEERRAGRVEESVPEAKRVVHVFGPAEIETTFLPSHAMVGAIVRVRLGAEPARPTLPRDFGAVHLDRSFEQNRRLLAWKQRGASIAAGDAPTLESVVQPLSARPLGRVRLDRESNADLVKQASFEFPEAPDRRTTFGQVAAAAWKAFGPASFAFPANTRGEIDLVWNDAATKLVLRFPSAKKQDVLLEATSLEKDAAVRRNAAQARDDADRQARIAGGKPLNRIGREIEGIRLGMTKEEFAAALPRSPSTHVREIPGGVAVSFVGRPKVASDASARQWFARFDGEGRAVEVRVRWEGAGASKKIDALKTKLGAPETSPADNAVWNDLPNGRPETRHVWHDDLTLLTAIQGSSVEVALRDCPAKHPQGTPLPPLAYLPRGVGPVHVGMTLAEALKLGASKADDAYLVTNPDDSVYDAVLVWFANDKAIRVVARHRLDGKEIPGPEQASHALLAAWSRDAALLGWPWRQDSQGPHAQSWSAIDETLRVRVFWQEEDGGLRLFGEWKAR